MPFNVAIIPKVPDHCDWIIDEVAVMGEPDKPAINLLPGGDVKGKIHACHIAAWSIIRNALTNQIKGVSLRYAAQYVFGLSEYQAQNVSAQLIKEYMESRLKQDLINAQSNVDNYYRGQAQANMSAGGKMGAAVRQLNEIYDQHKPMFGPFIATPQFAAGATGLQIKLFAAGYDEYPALKNEEKLMARADYVAYWYGIYFGGNEDSIRLAKYVFDTDAGIRAVDSLLQNGSVNL